MAAKGSLRIIGGQWRGRRLPIASVPGLRPTGDRMRETLFNWLGPWLPGASCLDLYAGTGALGLEARSRGAAAVTLVETNRRAVAALQSSCAALQADGIEIRSGAALDFLRSNPGRFDIVFLDPPFAARAWAPILAVLPGHLAPEHKVYVETPAQYSPDWSTQWRELRFRQAGAVAYRLLEYDNER